MASRHRENYLTLPIADFCNKIGQKLTSAIADSCQTAARYVRRGRDTRQHIAAKLEGMQYVIPQVHYMNWRAGARLAFPDRTRGG